MLDYIYANDDCITKVETDFNLRSLYYDSLSLFPPAYLKILKESYAERNLAIPRCCGIAAVQNNLVPLLLDFKTVKTDTIIDSIKKTFTPSHQLNDFNDLYPIAVRYTDNKNVWLIERPPFKATVNFKNAKSNQSSKKDFTFDIWVPWTLMLLHIIPEQSYYNAYLYFNDGPLNSNEDSFIPCIYPNMYMDARMCLNETIILLQQHLSSTQSFDISTIYNFIINDYMSGGWNTDLGVGFFRNQVSRCVNKDNSTLTVSAFKSITYGDKSKKISSALSSRGAVSEKKFTLNFLKYFSGLSLEEVTSIVTEFKNNNEIKASNLDTVLKNVSTFNSYNHLSKILFPDNFSSGSYINSKYIALIDYDHLNFLDSNTPKANEKLKDIVHKIYDLLYSENLKSINKLIENDDEQSISYVDFRNYKENNFIIITEDSVEIVDQYADVDFYFSKFPKLTLESANV